MKKRTLLVLAQLLLCLDSPFSFVGLNEGVG